MPHARLTSDAMGYLVDTNVFSELARAQPNEDVVSWLRAHEHELYVSSITIGELRHGVERLSNGKRKMKLQEWLTGICKRMDGRVLSFNSTTAHVWGQYLARWEKKGITIPSLDGQLAATALRHSLTVVTRNVADFRHTGVKIVNPFAP